MSFFDIILEVPTVWATVHKGGGGWLVEGGEGGWTLLLMVGHTQTSSTQCLEESELGYCGKKIMFCIFCVAIYLCIDLLCCIKWLCLLLFEVSSSTVTASGDHNLSPSRRYLLVRIASLALCQISVPLSQQETQVSAGLVHWDKKIWSLGHNHPNWQPRSGKTKAEQSDNLSCLWEHIWVID